MVIEVWLSLFKILSKVCILWFNCVNKKCVYLLVSLRLCMCVWCISVFVLLLLFIEWICNVVFYFSWDIKFGKFICNILGNRLVVIIRYLLGLLKWLKKLNSFFFYVLFFVIKCMLLIYKMLRFLRFLSIIGLKLIILCIDSNIVDKLCFWVWI